MKKLATYVFALGLTLLTLTGCGRVTSSTENSSSGTTLIAIPLQVTSNPTLAKAISGIVNSNESVAALPLDENQALKQLNESSVISPTEVGQTPQSLFGKFTIRKNGHSFSPFETSAPDADGYITSSDEFKDPNGDPLFRTQSLSKSVVTSSSNTLISYTHSHTKTGTRAGQSFITYIENQISDTTTTYLNASYYWRESIEESSNTTQYARVRFYTTDNPLLNPNAEPIGVFDITNARSIEYWNWRTMKAIVSLDMPGQFTVRNKTTGKEYSYELRLTKRLSGDIIETPLGNNATLTTIQGEADSTNIFAGKLKRDGKVVGIFQVAQDNRGKLSFKIYVFDTQGRPIPIDQYVTTQALSTSAIR